MAKLTRQEAEAAVASVHDPLDEHLKHAEKVLSQLRSDLGSRDHNTLYLYDDIHEALVLIFLLRRTLTSLVRATDTVRLPDGA